MNDETTKELEDLSTLACSTDEVVRKRALVAMLARVVGRASQVDHEWAGTDADDADRYALEANLREVTQQRDHARQQVREFDALLSRIWEAVPANIATPNSGLGIAEAVHALVERFMSDRFASDTAMQELTKARDTHKTNAETLARDLAEARAELEKTRGERDTARALRSVKDALPLETVLQCLGGVLNDMTRGGDFEKAEARSFHDSACIRLRSLAGSPEKAVRALTVEKFEDLAHASRLVFEHWDGDIMASHRAMFRWMEREGYLSVRLPPEE